MVIAGIGSRLIQENSFLNLVHVAYSHCIDGNEYRSGGALGCDTAFEEGVKQADGVIDIITAKDYIPTWAFVTVDFFHPKPKALDNYARRLMARNAMIIMGRDGDSLVDKVHCWTPDGKDSGGTGQGIRIARYFNIPVVNFNNTEEQNESNTLV